MSEFASKQVEIFYPFPGDIPWELLKDSGVDDDTADKLVQLPLIRVAKHNGEVIGVYVIAQQDDPAHYHLEALAVASEFRERGLGRWLVGHAIGVAEAKGARQITVTHSRYRRSLFASLGFRVEGGAWRLDIMPE